MIEFLLNLPLFAGIVLFMLIIGAIGIFVYLVVRKLIEAHLNKEHERVGRVLFRTSASLLALILSLTFANQRIDYIKIQNGLEIEAAQIVDVYVDLRMYETPEANRVIEDLKKYITYNAENSWTDIYGNALQSPVFDKFSNVHEAVYRLEPSTDMQRELKSAMLRDLDLMSDFLQIRLYTMLQQPLHLIYTSVFGILAVMIFFSVYTPNRLNIVFISIYNFFLGLVLYFVLMMSNPLHGPLQLEGKAFQLLLHTIEQEANNR